MFGRAWKLGKNVDTDCIIPARYVHITDARELGKHCLEGLDPEFTKKIKEGDIIVADSNFGCGSSREVAPVAIKGAGIGCVIARNFARIFFRNSINIGLPIFESPEAVDGIEEGDMIEVIIEEGKIRNITKSRTFNVTPLPPFVQKIVEYGGLMKCVKEKLRNGDKGKNEKV